MGWKFNGKGITGTCYECKDRYLGCHDHCERYITAKKEWFETQQRNKKAKNEYLMIYRHHAEAIRKTTKKGR